MKILEYPKVESVTRFVSYEPAWKTVVGYVRQCLTGKKHIPPTYKLCFLSGDLIMTVNFEEDKVKFGHKITELSDERGTYFGVLPYCCVGDNTFECSCDYITFKDKCNAA